MRKMKVKRPEKETATTAREEGHDSSLRGAPSAMPEQHLCYKDRDQEANCKVIQEMKTTWR